MFTNALIPKDGIWITETYFPRGFTVGKYNSDGHVFNPRWFDRADKAEQYARGLK